MSNPKGNPATLTKYTPKWNNGVTRTIRVPVAIADEILDYAHQLDDKALTQVNGSASDNSSAIAIALRDINSLETLTQVIENLKQVCETPNTSKFTKALKTKVEKQISSLEPLVQMYGQKCKIGGQSQDV